MCYDYEFVHLTSCDLSALATLIQDRTEAVAQVLLSQLQFHEARGLQSCLCIKSTTGA